MKNTDRAKASRREWRQIVGMLVFLFVVATLEFVCWPHKSLVSWLTFAALLVSLCLFIPSIMDLWRRGVGWQNFKDKNAWKALKKPLIAIVPLIFILVMALILPIQDAAQKLSIAIVSDVLLVAGVGFAYWAHESRRLGVLSPPPGSDVGPTEPADGEEPDGRNGQASPGAS